MKSFINQNSITMKKTLMVLTFALCATFGFAQTQKMSGISVADKPVRVSDMDTKLDRAGYTGSIFTKDGELFLCDFSQGPVATEAQLTGTNYLTAKCQSGDLVDGQQVPVSTSDSYYGQWQRMADTTANTWTNATVVEHYPVLTSRFYPNGWFEMLQSDDPNNGYLLMSMIDCYTPWGGDGEEATYSAYFRFAPFATTGYSMIRVRLFQVYRAFNYDHCYIDYSTNGTTWSTVEFNVRGVEMNVNTNYFGWKTVTMPVSLGNQANVHLRVRWSDESGNQNGGYFWLVDDFQVLEVPQYSMNVVSNQYFEGFYHMIPQNLNLPVVWVSEMINNGQNNQTNLSGTVYQYAPGQAATPVVSKTLGTLVSDPTVTRSIVIDPLGWYDSASTYHGYNYDDAASYKTGQMAFLPTSTTGTYHFFADFSTDQRAHAVNDTTTFDTLRYEVNYNASAEHPYGIWSRDYGVIRKGAYYASGLIASSTFSTDPEDTKWNEAGYGVMVSYVTGNDVPEGWKVLGVEITPSTEVNMQRAGSIIEPVLRYDFVDDTGASWIGTFATGASPYTVQQADVLSGDELAELEYEMYGSQDNPTIRIMFPNQPELYSNLSYRIGYRLVEEANFAVATCYNSFVRAGADTTVYFDEVEGMESYGHVLTSRYNRFEVAVSDPYDDKLHMFSSPTTLPMIRMIVGPGYYVPKTAVSFECDDPDMGSFQNSRFVVICDSIDSVAIGGSASYYIMPEEGYMIDKVWMDGVELVAGEDYTIEEDESTGEKYGVITLSNVQEPHTLRCSFKEWVGFDPLSNDVRMRLQPNPATTNVHVALNGVSGQVNMALIDMSGRVVSTSQFNAENGVDINVSNLAKGAYFVRITNSRFSKVEKLIVR